MSGAEFLIVGVPDPVIAEENIRATLHVPKHRPALPR
jgi:hypothetical protein